MKIIKFLKEKNESSYVIVIRTNNQKPNSNS